MDPSGVFGAAKAGLPFDPISFIKKPQVILRLISLLFSIIVFGCINSGGYHEEMCLYAYDPNACSFGFGVGLFGFFGALGLLVVDALFDTISNVKRRKWAVIVDVGFSGLWTVLWFVSFCYLTNKWSLTAEDFLVSTKVPTWKQNNVRSAIVFSIFSFFLWGGITFFAVQRMRLGLQSAFEPASQIEEQVAAQHGGNVGIGGGAYPDMMAADPTVAYSGGAYSAVGGVMPSHHPYSGGQPMY